MKCEACGAGIVEGAKNCSACGREVSLGQKAATESVHVVRETGAVAGKIGKELWGGVKAVGSSVKKGSKRSQDDEKKA